MFYAIGIFLSAFLQFLVEPMTSKALLPWFGGASMVWSSAMLFFQVLLAGGYAYANRLARRTSIERQTRLHLLLLGISICILIGLWFLWPSPVTPGMALQPDNNRHPLLSLLSLLLISIGLPFFLLAASNPLLQSWYHRTQPGRSSYWLYSLSNLGSLLGLLAYPFLVEPVLTMAWQGRLWTIGFLVFAAFVAINAIGMHGKDPAPPTTSTGTVQGVKAPTRTTQWLWLLLAACGAMMMLAVTNQLTQDVAAIPFLWVLPLSVYLMTFVLAFSGRRWYQRKIFATLLVVASLAWFVLSLLTVAHFVVEISLYAILLFAACMVCHGELYGLRPPDTQLTRFYLLVTLGGALGGVFVNLLAPLLFKGFWELYIGVAFTWILLAVLSRGDLDLRSESTSAATTYLMAFLASLHLAFMIYYSLTGNLLIRRNFYGVVDVREREIGTNREKAYVLVDGTTVHGFQYSGSTDHDTPTTYYTRESGIGLAIIGHPRYGNGLRVGVLGLGVGTLAAYGHPGDTYRFYEINPAVIELAGGQGGYFSFLKDSPAVIEVVPGDARLSLAREMGNDFDILVLDAFSSDAIPVHLLTREAFTVYLQNLAPGGLIAAHISNARLDLRPVFWQVAHTFDLEFAVVENPAEWQDPDALPSTWVLLTRNPELFERPGLTGVINQGLDFKTDIHLWTDDSSNLLQLVK